MSRVVVVGAGPAGMHAALTAADAGAEVVLVDAAPRVGGQYHRQPRAGAPDPALARLSGAISEHPRIRHLAQTSVWAVEPAEDGHRLHLRTGPADGADRTATVVDAHALVLATGAYDRVLPFPGWDLPGVYTAGAAQALAKGQGVAIGQRVLLAGTGPFLFTVAEALLRVGVTPQAVLDATSPRTALRGWLRDPRALLAGRSKIADLARYLRLLRRHKISYRQGSAVIAAHGVDRVTEVTTARLDPAWRIVPGTLRKEPVDALCLGYGFTPQLELAVAIGCETTPVHTVVVDADQATSVPGVFAAGEITGIGGADLAAAEGVVAGHAAAAHVGVGEPAPRRALRRVRAGRRFAAGLARAYPISPGWREWLTPDTVICRCENVRRQTLQDAIADHPDLGVRSLKLLTRIGLGPCQGRICGRAAADLTGIPGAFANRPIAAPIRLGELATTPLTEEET